MHAYVAGVGRAARVSSVALRAVAPVGGGYHVTVREISGSAWVLSDTHWGHVNIARLQGRPSGHEHLMRRRWLALVSDGALVLHLGDLVMGRRDRAGWHLVGLTGTKVLVRGNHDKLGATLYTKLGWELVEGPLCWTNPGGQRVALSHRPLLDDGSWDVNVHGHVHGGKPAVWDDGKRVNACVEVRAYSPAQLDSLLTKL